MRLCTSPLGHDAETTTPPDSFLCWAHRNWLRLDALDAIEVYDQIVDRLAYGTGTDYEPRVRTSKVPGLDLDPVAVAARDLIAHVFRNWVEILAGAGARGPYPEPSDVRGLGQFIARNASRLAAHEHAGGASEELHDLAHGAPHRAAYPNGETSIRVVEGERCLVRDCGGDMRAIMRRAASLVPSVLVCSIDDLHRWTPHEWVLLVDQGDELVEAAVVAAALGFSDAGAVYQLARRGQLTRMETGDGPRYSLADVRRLARSWQDAA